MKVGLGTILANSSWSAVENNNFSKFCSGDMQLKRTSILSCQK